MVLPLAILSLMVRNVWHVMKLSIKWYFCDLQIAIAEWANFYKTCQREKLNKYPSHSFVIYDTAKTSWEGHCTPDSPAGTKKKVEL